MANGHVEIHDPISNHNDLGTSSGSEPRPTSDLDDMDDTVEFRLLMAYTKRRRPDGGAASPAQHALVAQTGDLGPSSPQAPATTEKAETPKKKKRGIRNLPKFFSCIKPRTKEDEPVRRATNAPDADDRCLDAGGESPSDEAEEEDKLAEVASRLTEIADEIPFAPSEIEPDCPSQTEKEEGDVEKVIGVLLRDAGDVLNEQVLKDANITAELFMNYSFFEKLVKAFLIRMGLLNPQPDALGPQASPKTQIAVTCEVTSRLAAANTLPMSRMLYHGARYLQDHYSTWAQQHGGYEEAFHEEEEEDEDEVQ